MKRKTEESAAVQKRCDVYTKLMAMSKIEAYSCDMSKGDELVKLLDASVILMEDGSDFDLTVLDKPLVEATVNKDTLTTTQPDKDGKHEEEAKEENKDVV